ncbi:MAG: shikimate kinase [Promethearchaeota archaeon]
MDPKKSLTLVGMPGSGKSTIGKLLAESLNYTFIDTDNYIEKREKKKLQQLIDEIGDESFCAIEEKCILELLPLNNHILAPGGSIIYSKKLMESLRNQSIIIFLDLPLNEIENRLKNKESRGIVGLKTKNLKELFKERVPLYKKYADLIISCDNKTELQIAEEIIKKIKG